MTTAVRPHLLLVGGKDSSFRSITDLDIDVTLIQERDNLTALQIERAHQLVLLDAVDDDLAVEVARDLHRVRPFDGVLSFFESCLELASLIGASLDVPSNPLAAVRLTRDKVAMRELLADHEIASVEYYACDNVSDLAAFAGKIGSPVIVKPARGSGSRGVALLDSPDTAASAWQWCMAGGPPPAIAEEFVTGQELSVETITLAGRHLVLGITEKITTGAPSFIEIGHQMPARLDPATCSGIGKLVVRLLDAVGHQWGPAHTEVMLTDDRGPVVIETQTRFGGDQIWEMVELTAGVRLAGTTAAALAGLVGPPALDRSGDGPVVSAAVAADAAAAIRFFAYEAATVVSVSGVDEARAMPGVVRVEVRAEAGQRLGRLQSSWSRQGYVLATGATTDEAVARAESAKESVVFELEESP